MSATVTMTAALPPPTLSLSTDRSEQHSCPSCGVVIEPPPALLEAQARIADLEAQVRLLNQKAAAAVDRWADYEDELTRLRIAASHTPAPQPTPSPTRTSFLSGGANRLSQLLSPRGMKSTPNLRAPTPPGPGDPATTEYLLEALNREQNLRVQAEARLSTTSQEVEELSVSLFEQANEMVATERRARAKLEERVEVLERRDQDKKRRLERLEGAVGRIERVRSLLGELKTTTSAEPGKQEADARASGETRPESAPVPVPARTSQSSQL
ncbi:ribosomal protein l32 [Colletotrichum plurivorum]|uniref:Ribosomal protein l32 n=1 Tax=Colletotrichum plurivorum TaxID=2175906 RepID=A0A8H6U696_9PEZI|nr:ribosomal protein l32 [Colletotrichum plurivorum]